MKCPHCDVTLAVSERQGIEIDHCPQCRGVWLDRGELDKIIDRAARYDRRDDDDDDDDDDDRRRYAPSPQQPYGQQQQQPPVPPQQYPERYHKKKSFWSELFD